MATKPCLFCNTPAEWRTSVRDAQEIACEVCTRYEVTGVELHSLKPQELPTSQRVLAINQMIQDSTNGVIPIWTSADDTSTPPKPYLLRSIESYRELPISHASKPDELLLLMARKLRGENPFNEIRFTLQDAYTLKMDGFGELQQWLKIVLAHGYLESPQFKGMQNTVSAQILDIKEFPFQPTPKGWTRVEQLFQNVHSKKAFIAMSFGHEERTAIQSAIEAACKKTGWDGFTIDKKEHIKGITDEIIASINQSRFVVAEFTGNNHGVYYEAGYAAGKGIPVILTVKKAQLDDLTQGVHFDTRHINHIVWDSYDDLTKKLINRINAVIT